MSISPKAPTFGEYSFQALCLHALGCRSSRRDDLRVPSHLFYCFPGVCCPCRVLPVSPGHDVCYWDGSAPLCPSGTGEHAMEACQIGSRSGDQGRHACNKVQWFEDDMSGARPNGQSTSWATLSTRYSQSTRFAHGLGPAHGASFLDRVFSTGSEHYHPMLTTSAFPKRPGGCRRNCP
jgi:hypothetical protein